METADDYKILYGLLSAYRGQVLDEADRLGADGVPDEAASRLADADVLDAALDIIKTDAELRFPADTVAP